MGVPDFLQLPKVKTHRHLLFLVSLLMLVLVSQRAGAQPVYPTKPIRMVSPFPAGGGLDVVARKVASKLDAELGQPVLVDNKTGASGTIGADNVAKAAPDGYTILITTGSTMSILPHVMKRLPYRPEDLSPVIQVGTTPFVFAINANDPAQTLAEFIANAKAKPGTVTFGSTGNATLAHLLGEALNRAAGIRMTHVPYKGSAPGLTDLLGGQISSVMTDFASVRPYLQAGGRLRVLAITGARRNAAFPAIPTFAELGYGALEPMTGSIVVFAPTSTPKLAVDRLVAAISAGLQSADTKATLASLGYEPTGISGSDLAALTHQDSLRWEKIIREIGGVSID